MSRQFPLRSSNNPNAETAAIPDEDTSEVSNLFEQRLQAWKHAVSYLEDYIGATEKLHKSNAKEYDNVLKTVNSPLKEGDHFDGNPGGMVEMFESFRTNTQVCFASLISAGEMDTKRLHQQGDGKYARRDFKNDQDQRSTHLRAPALRDQDEKQGA